MPIRTPATFACTVIIATVVLAGCGGGSDGPGSAITLRGGTGGGADPTTPPPATTAPAIDLDDSLASDSPAIALDATVSAATGYAWTIVSGPGPAVFDPPDSMGTTVRVAIGGTYVLRLTASSPGGSASDEITVEVTTERYALAGTVTDSDGGTVDAVNLDWSPLGGRMLSSAPGGDGAWSFGDLVAPIEQLSLHIPGG